ncbi:MAG: adenine deaminase [Muribaculaceae bacterium]|nr:adenine deaminase [Muribaculaceae bacterium]
MNYTENLPDGRLIVRGHIVDVIKRYTYDGEIVVAQGKIESITKRDDIPADAPYYMPGFIDGHVHVESSMMLPTEFARIATQHGTVGAICDPHEIANVIGTEGVRLMLDSARASLFHFAFGCPSCVPACGPSIETSGHTIDSKAVAQLMQDDEIWFLGEMMNFPGVLNHDSEVMAKVKAALDAGKPVDGHAPGLVGESRMQYTLAGITTDHECTTLTEGRDAVACGMIVQIREGSAAKDYAALSPLISEAPGHVMLCTDDSHPTDLVRGHINLIVQRALADGYNIMDILQAACVTPVHHYGLPVGLLQPGDSADFIGVDNLSPNFRIIKTYIKGERVFSSTGHDTAIAQLERSVAFQSKLRDVNTFNMFNASPITVDDIATQAHGDVHVIVASDGSLLTGHEVRPLTRDIQKIVVLNRYTPGAKPQVGFIKGFNITNGAFAQTIAHDCHNIMAVGSNDEMLVEVINRVIKMEGGIAATDGIEMTELPLPIGGLMSAINGHEIAHRSMLLEETVSRAGCHLRSPFITLGFMALPVIPKLKLTDKGLLDTAAFQFIQQ